MTTKQPGESRSGTALPEIREGITMTIRRRHMAKSPYTTLQGAMRMKELADQPGGKACGNCDRPFSHANRPASLFLAEYENTVTRMAIHSEYLLCWPCCNRAKLDGKESLARVKDKAEAAYARSDVFEKRRKMMEAWANHLSQQAAKVVALGV